jgi:hypothetical protein
MKSQAIISVALVLGVAAITLGARVDKRPIERAAVVASTSSSDGFIFEGCWEQNQAGPCYDIFRDAAGNYWKCKKCGETKNANQSSCNPISLQTLNSGSWCS